jgi:hypothetical protein
VAPLSARSVMPVPAAQLPPRGTGVPPRAGRTPPAKSANEPRAAAGTRLLRSRPRSWCWGITSLHFREAAPEHLAAYARGHWSIENKIHWVRDVTLRENASQLKRGSRSLIMTTLPGHRPDQPNRPHKDHRHHPEDQKQPTPALDHLRPAPQPSKLPVISQSDFALHPGGAQAYVPSDQ